MNNNLIFPLNIFCEDLLENDLRNPNLAFFDEVKYVKSSGCAAVSNSDQNKNNLEGIFRKTQEFIFQ